MRTSTFKKIVSIALAIAMCAMLAACSSGGEAPVQPPAADDPGSAAPVNGETSGFDGTILIGVCCDLTGQNSLAGVTIANSAKLAAKQINAQGGILGKEVVLEIVDDQSQADVGINAIQKLCANEDLVAIAGGLIFTGIVLATEDIVEQYNIPTIVGGSSPSIVETGNPWLFRIRVNDAVTNDLTFSYFRDETDFKVWGQVYATTDYGTNRNTIFKSFCTDNNIEYYAVNGNVGDKDWTAQIMDLKKNGCDLVFLDLDVIEQAVVVQQMYDLGYKPQLTGGSLLGSTEFLDVVPPEASEGVIFVGETALDSTVPGFQEFRQAYLDEYGAEPHSSAICMQPGLWLLKDAIERAGTTDHEAVREALASTVDFKAVTGNLTYDTETGIDMNRSVLFSRIENGKGVCFLALNVD